MESRSQEKSLRTQTDSQTRANDRQSEERVVQLRRRALARVAALLDKTEFSVYEPTAEDLSGLWEDLKEFLWMVKNSYFPRWDEKNFVDYVNGTLRDSYSEAGWFISRSSDVLEDLMRELLLTRQTPDLFGGWVRRVACLYRVLGLECPSL